MDSHCNMAKQFCNQQGPDKKKVRELQSGAVPSSKDEHR